MAEVARRAGVGRATLYRNFATRRQLLEALFADEVEAMAAATPSEDPATAFFDWLQRLAAFEDNKHAIVSELLEYADPQDPVFSGSRQRVISAGEHVLSSAQQSGHVRTDVSIEQALDHVLAVARLDRPRDQLNAILQLALDGLRPSR